MSDNQELFDVLTKTLIALDRIQDALQPIVNVYKEQIMFMPPPPVGLPDCVRCEGAGFYQFVNKETDCWNTALCDCNG